MSPTIYHYLVGLIPLVIYFVKCGATNFINLYIYFIKKQGYFVGSPMKLAQNHLIFFRVFVPIVYTNPFIVVSVCVLTLLYILKVVYHLLKQNKKLFKCLSSKISFLALLGYVYGALTYILLGLL